MPRVTFRTSIVAAALAVAAYGLTAYADAPDDGAKEKPEGRQSQDGSPRRGPPRPPIEMALDKDHDNEISAEEMQDATASLKKLDKNGDGKLTPDEYRPRRPDQQARDGNGPPRDGNGPPRDGNGPPRDGKRPPRDGKGPPRDGDKPGGDCPDGPPKEKQ